MSTILKALRQLEDERNAANVIDPLADEQLRAAQTTDVPPFPTPAQPSRWHAAALAGAGGALLATALVLAWMPSDAHRERDRVASLPPLSPVSAPEPSAAVPAPVPVVAATADPTPIPATAPKDATASAPANVVAVVGARAPGLDGSNRADPVAATTSSASSLPPSQSPAPGDADVAAAAVSNTPPVVVPSALPESPTPEERPSSAVAQAAPVREVQAKPVTVARASVPVAPQAPSVPVPATPAAPKARPAPVRAATPAMPAPKPEARVKAPVKRTSPPIRRTPPIVPEPRAAQKLEAAAPNVARGVAPVEAVPPRSASRGVDPMIPEFARARREAPTPLIVNSTVWHPVATRRTAKVVASAGAPAREVREGDRIGSLTIVEITPSGVVFDEQGIAVTRRVGDRD